MARSSTIIYDLSEAQRKSLRRLAAELGFKVQRGPGADHEGSLAALLRALADRYGDQPGLVRNALREALFTASEIAVYRACVDEMLAERDAPRPEDFIV